MMKDEPRWLVRVLWFYSGWFRYGGLAFAVLSALFLIMTGFTMFGPPLAGVIAGLALYKFVPRVALPQAKSNRD